MKDLPENVVSALADAIAAHPIFALILLGFFIFLGRVAKDVGKYYFDYRRRDRENQRKHLRYMTGLTEKLERRGVTRKPRTPKRKDTGR